MNLNCADQQEQDVQQQCIHTSGKEKWHKCFSGKVHRKGNTCMLHLASTTTRDAQSGGHWLPGIHVYGERLLGQRWPKCPNGVASHASSISCCPSVSSVFHSISSQFDSTPRKASLRTSTQFRQVFLSLTRAHDFG